MICYICDQQGKRTEAVGICIVCGMAVCREHLVREELPLWERVHTGLADQRRELPERLPRFLCPECARALHQARGR